MQYRAVESRPSIRRAAAWQREPKKQYNPERESDIMRGRGRGWCPARVQKCWIRKEQLGFNLGGSSASRGARPVPLEVRLAYLVELFGTFVHSQELLPIIRSHEPVPGMQCCKARRGCALFGFGDVRSDLASSCNVLVSFEPQ